MARNKNNITKNILLESPNIDNNISTVAEDPTNILDPLLGTSKPGILNVNNLSLGDNVISTQEDTLQIENIPSKTINRNFGLEGDYIELQVSDESNNLLERISNFKDYEINKEDHTLSIDSNLILENLGYTSGKYNITIYLLRNKVFNTTEHPFIVNEVSPTRRELKSISTLPNDLFISSVSQFITEIETTAYFKEFSLIFDDGKIVPAINIR